MKVWNKRDPNVPKDAVLVDRTTKWGNPFRIGKDAAGIYWSRDDVIQLHKSWFQGFEKSDFEWHGLQDDLHELRGKDLVCWCAPLPCHADTLMELANKEETNGTD